MGVSVRQKEPGGPWWVFIRHRNRRKSKLVGDKKAANELASEIRKALAANDLGIMLDGGNAAGVTFETYAKQYLDKVEPDDRDPEHGLKRSTWRDYKQCLDNRLIPALGNRPLSAITRRDVKDLAERLRVEGLAAGNVRKHLRVLSSVLSEAVEDELIEANPVLALRKHRRSKQQGAGRRIDPLTPEELNTLLSTAQTHAIERSGKTVNPYRRSYPFLLLLARTGMRLGEAIALKWGDIDWRAKFIRVQRAYVRGEISSPKSGKSRDVDLTDQLLVTLRELYRDRFERVAALDAEQQAALDAEKARAMDSWIFPDISGGPLDEYNFRHRVWYPLLAAAKLRHLRIHDLRHTYASTLLAKGVELQYVQQQLGHHSPAFTLTVYGHLLPKDRRGLVNQLDDAAPAGTPTAPATGTTVSPEALESENPKVAQGVF